MRTTVVEPSMTEMSWSRTPVLDQYSQIATSQVNIETDDFLKGGDAHGA